MASSFDKDIRSLEQALQGVGKKFAKELEEGMKNLNSITRSAEDLGKKMNGWVDPAALTTKKLAEMQVQETALKNKALEMKSIQERALSDVFRINSYIKERNELEAKRSAGVRLTVTEELRLNQLVADNLETQRLLIGRKAGQAGMAARAAEQEASALKRNRELYDKILGVYQTIMSLAEGYDKLLSDTAKAQGTTKDEINNQYKEIQKVNTGLSTNLASNQEILAAVTAIRKEYALTGPQLAAIGKESANISRLTGLSVDEATKFQTTLAEVGGTSVMAQEAMTAIASKAAEAAGVPIGTVMRDVASASGAVRTIFKGNTAELIKQAAEARKLGTSLDGMAKSAEALLNFESSIGAELKASALLGQNINFNESRRLAFAGDLLGAEKALQKEVERVGDLDKLNYNQRKALAEATGKDFGELQKIQTQRKNMLEAERMFPEEAEKMKKAQKELEKLQKGGLEARKEELKKILEQKTAEAELQKLTQAKQEALNNIGKLMKPLYDLIMGVQVYFFKFISLITNIENPLGKWAAVGVTAILLVIGTFKLLKGTLSSVLNFLGDALAKAAESAGTGVGKGLEAMANGIKGMASAFGSISPAQLIKMALVLGILTLSVMGLAKAFSMLGSVSGEQIMTFTAALVILGASLVALGAIMLIPGLNVGVILFAAALGIVSLAAIGFAKAIQMIAPSLAILGVIFTGLATIVAGVLTKAFETMLAAFKQLPEVIAGVSAPLIKLALVAPLLLVGAAGITALSYSLGILGAAMILFPTRELTRITTQLSLLSNAAAGIKVAAGALKELSGTKLPELNIDVKGAEVLAKMNETKDAGMAKLEEGLRFIADRVDNLTETMVNGGISVNLDGQKVNYALAKSSNTRGSLGQATF